MLSTKSIVHAGLKPHSGTTPAPAAQAAAYCSPPRKRWEREERFESASADDRTPAQTFVESDLDWTMVRPPQLTDKPYTGTYRVREGHLPRFGFKISRADVADFMIKTVENSSTIHKVVGVCT